MVLCVPIGFYFVLQLAVKIIYKILGLARCNKHLNSPEIENLENMSVLILSSVL